MDEATADLLKFDDVPAPYEQSLLKKIDPAEIDSAFNVCVEIIDNPPEEYKLVKQAVLGIVHLTARRDDLRAKGMLKILQVVKDANKYRSNPRRYAVHSLASMTYYDEKLIEPCIQIFSQLAKPSSENSQYVRKATFVALSRIGRRYPSLQDQLIPIFSQYYHNPKVKESVLWGIIIGLGRMAQSNALLRSVFAKEWIRWCEHKSFRLRWAGIKGLGHACCSIGNVVYDMDLAQQCFEIATEFVKHGGVETIKKIAQNSENTKKLESIWKEEQVYLVQYAAVQALGLLLRSNPDVWWSKISPIFGQLLLNPHIAVMIKAMILITYGKIAYYLEPSNPYYSSIHDLLSSLSKNENILVAEPATYGLVNFALAHDEYYEETKKLVISKLEAPVTSASKEKLQYYLKTWCKIIARDYQPILNLCSKVISEHSAQTLASLKSQYATNWTVGSFGTQTDEDRKMDLQDSTLKARGVEPCASERIETVVHKMANDQQTIFDLCTNFSYRVIQSVFVMLEDPTVLDDRAFLNNLKKMITVYSGKVDKTDIDQKGISVLITRLQQTDPVLRESALRILKDPDVLDDLLWLSNLKLILFSLRKEALPIQYQVYPTYPGTKMASNIGGSVDGSAHMPLVGGDHQAMMMPIKSAIMPTQGVPASDAYYQQRPEYSIHNDTAPKSVPVDAMNANMPYGNRNQTYLTPTPIHHSPVAVPPARNNYYRRDLYSNKNGNYLDSNTKNVNPRLNAYGGANYYGGHQQTYWQQQRGDYVNAAIDDKYQMRPAMPYSTTPSAYYADGMATGGGGQQQHRSSYPNDAAASLQQRSHANSKIPRGNIEHQQWYQNQNWNFHQQEGIYQAHAKIPAPAYNGNVRAPPNAVKPLASRGETDIANSNNTLIFPIFSKPQIVPPLLPQNQQFSTYQLPADFSTAPPASGSFIFNRFPHIDEENTAELLAAYIQSAKNGEYAGLLLPLLTDDQQCANNSKSS